MTDAVLEKKKPPFELDEKVTLFSYSTRISKEYGGAPEGC